MSTNIAVVPPPPGEEKKPEEPRVNHSEGFVLAWGVFFFILFGVACALYCRKSQEAQSGFISALFFFPLLQVPSVIWMLRSKPDFRAWSSGVLMPTLSLQMVLWICYTFKTDLKAWLSALGWLSMGSAFALAAVALWVTWLIMGMSGEKARRFKQVLREHPFMVTCFFLTIFTFVTYFLSLSLAFHDQGLRLNQHAVDLYAADQMPVPQAFPEIPPGGESSAGPTKILFARGSASIDIDSEFEGFPGERQVLKLPAEERRKAYNAIRFKNIVEEIGRQSEQDRVRVILVGHSDDSPVGNGSYKSNFELSQARTHQVLLLLLSRLESLEQTEWRRNIEWLVLPCANEQRFLDGHADRDATERLSVEIAVLPSYGDKFTRRNPVESHRGRDLDLLDYVYFGVYTITTTGYGDIVPVSSYAKFVTTIANFFEVFLMVIFFNVLISFFSSTFPPERMTG